MATPSGFSSADSPGARVRLSLSSSWTTGRSRSRRRFNEERKTRSKSPRRNHRKARGLSCDPPGDVALPYVIDNRREGGRPGGSKKYIDGAGSEDSRRSSPFRGGRIALIVLAIAAFACASILFYTRRQPRAAVSVSAAS